MKKSNDNYWGEITEDNYCNEMKYAFSIIEYYYKETSTINNIVGNNMSGIEKEYEKIKKCIEKAEKFGWDTKSSTFINIKSNYKKMYDKIETINDMAD